MNLFIIKNLFVFVSIVLISSCVMQKTEINNEMLINKNIETVKERINILNHSFEKTENQKENIMIFKSNVYILPDEKKFHDLYQYTLISKNKNQTLVQLNIYQVGEKNKKLITDDYVLYNKLLSF